MRKLSKRGRTLDAALGDLCWALKATHAIVVDQSEWGWGSHFFNVPIARVREDAERFYLRNVAPRRAELKRGKKLYVCQSDYRDSQVGDALVQISPHIAKSFASIYVLVAWFDAPFEELEARALVDAALPNIERLTLALPPTDGPNVTSGAAKGRA